MNKLWIVLLLLSVNSAYAEETKPGFTPEQRKEIESIAQTQAKDYLAQHPEAVVSALETHQKQQAQLAAQPSDQDVVLGKDKAPVTLIEYASLSCPHCAKFYNDVFPALKKKYIDTGKVKFIFRDFPLNEPALKGSLLARCVGKDKYYDVLHALFATQEKWAFDKGFADKLAEYGKQHGLSQKQIDTCMQDKQLQEKVLNARKEGSEKFAINSTPGFVLNGQKTEDLHSVEEFSKAIDALLEKK